MIPAAYASSLPFNPNLDPFEIFFILDEQEFQQDYEWLNSLNNDSTLTLNLFKIRVFPKKKLSVTGPGERILKALRRSNVIAQVLHQDKGLIHVEHQNIKLSDGDTERFRQSLNLFLLQLCRANVDEIREMKYFSQYPQNRVIKIFDRESPIEKSKKPSRKFLKYYHPEFRDGRFKGSGHLNFKRKRLNPIPQDFPNIMLGLFLFYLSKLHPLFQITHLQKTKKIFWMIWR